MSSTRMFTLRPELSTWSRPPNPMSYAQPSPPMIQTPWRTRSPARASSRRASVGLLAVDARRGPRAAGPPARAGGRSPPRPPARCPGCSRASSSPTTGARPVSSAARLVGLGVHGQAHAQAELGVVLEQGVGPGRAASGGVDRPRAWSAGWRRRSRSSPWRWRSRCGRRTAGSPAAGRASRRSRRTRRRTRTAARSTWEPLTVSWAMSPRSSSGMRREVVPADPLHVAMLRDRLHVDGLVAAGPSCSWRGRRPRTRRSRCSRRARPRS